MTVWRVTVPALIEVSVPVEAEGEDDAIEAATDSVLDAVQRLDPLVFTADLDDVQWDQARGEIVP